MQMVSASRPEDVAEVGASQVAADNRQQIDETLFNLA